MTASELKLDILGTAQSTINIAREKCYNNFSENVEFVIRRFNADDISYINLLKLRKKIYENSPKFSVDNIVKELIGELNGVRWIDLTLYKEEKERTIFEIQLFKRPTNEIVDSKDINISFHGGVPIPNYAANHGNKFDINWQQLSIKHKWKLFWWKVKIFLELKKYHRVQTS